MRRTTKEQIKCEQFGERLKQIQKEEDISNVLLAEWLGMQVSAISKWRCGKTYPLVAELIMLCETLQVSMDWLVLGKGEKKWKQQS